MGRVDIVFGYLQSGDSVWVEWIVFGYLQSGDSVWVEWI